MEVINKFGSIIGKVSDNEDPDKQGRVKVKLELIEAGKLSLESKSGNVTIKASQNITLKGGNVKLN